MSARCVAPTILWRDLTNRATAMAFYFEYKRRLNRVSQVDPFVCPAIRLPYFTITSAAGR
jgi:hypothetical protein